MCYYTSFLWSIYGHKYSQAKWIKLMPQPAYYFFFFLTYMVLQNIVYIFHTFPILLELHKYLCYQSELVLEFSTGGLLWEVNGLLHCISWNSLSSVMQSFVLRTCFKIITVFFAKKKCLLRIWVISMLEPQKTDLEANNKLLLTSHKLIKTNFKDL